jgi:flavoprotein hydroxylase
MRLPHETVTDLNTEETAWRLLSRWDLTPENCDLERHTVYTFQARWADTWRKGRLLIAGDAAHLMPPFAGQGMCSGVRDAANLAWKLDLVLTGRVDDGLLDSYGSERSAHVQNAIGMSVELGNVICMTDPVQAAARDELMLRAEGRPELALPPVPPPVLGPGVLHTGPDGSPLRPAGELGWQGRVADREGTAGRLDEVVGTGWIVLSAVDPSPWLTPPVRWILDELRAVVVHVTEDEHRDGVEDESVRVVTDLEARILPPMRAGGHDVLVIRPDFYIFGAGASVDALEPLLQELAELLRLRQPTSPTAG